MREMEKDGMEKVIVYLILFKVSHLHHARRYGWSAIYSGAFVFYAFSNFAFCKRKQSLLSEFVSR